ncbi:DinB family protein [Kineococcus arenarius]|uniref:DinB family protein n=1 Tax=Kineococcus sp. SYSU DK007 TaxID=3383128 RepID=UPI003D7DB91E
MTTTTNSPGTSPTTGSTGQAREVEDLLRGLEVQRQFLRFTVRGLTDEQAARRTTVSELRLGGLIKHVSGCEAGWIGFITEGPRAVAGDDGDSWAGAFRMEPGEHLADLLDAYEAVARRTEQVVRALPDLDAEHELPPAPWFEPGARWTVRQVLLHVLAETAQHSGHADVLRESLDGQKTMG